MLLRQVMRRHVLLAGFAIMLIQGFGCMGVPGDGNNGDNSDLSARRRFPLDTLPTAEIKVKDQTLRVWIADDAATQEEGLMYVSNDQIADDQGMLFVFTSERQLSFWMRNTIIPLDIAYARTDGTIVQTWTMPPLTLQSFPSIEPAIYALEMKSGSFERLGIAKGDRLVIPDTLLKAAR